MSSSLADRMKRVLRADVQGMHAYAVQPSTGMVKVDTMENPFGLPPDLRRALGERAGSALRVVGRGQPQQPVQIGRAHV